MARPVDDVPLADAHDPLVLAVDVGSTATRGGLYDAAGRPVSGRRHKIPHAFTTAGDGTSEIDPDQVVAEVEQIVDAVTDDASLGSRVRAVAMDTFAASLVLVDGRGHPLTRCLTYADSRCAPDVATLRAELDEAAVQQRTGARIHTSYHAPRLRWLARTRPGLLAGSPALWSLGEYVVHRLTGQVASGTSTAAWTGLLDRRTGQWDAELLAACDVGPDQLAPVHDPADPLPPAPTRWPALAEAVWFPVITDGLAHNVGAGATDPQTIAASCATSGALRVLVPGPAEPLPFGLWNYRVDSGRTLLGGAVNDVGRALSWARGTFALDGTDEAGVMTAAPSAGTPLVLPYLTGERAPGWVGQARATATQVTAATTPESLLRATMEGVALTLARVASELLPAAAGVERIMAAGRVTNDLPEWLQVLADVLARPVTHVTLKRSTLRGTVLLALDHLAPDVPRAPRATGATYEPAPEHAGHYAERRAAFEELYDTLVGGRP